MPPVSLIPGDPPLARPVPLQRLRVIFALIVRDMNVKFGRSVGGYLWAIAEPLGGIVLLAVAFSLVAMAGSSAAFAAPQASAGDVALPTPRPITLELPAVSSAATVRLGVFTSVAISAARLPALHGTGRRLSHHV